MIWTTLTTGNLTVDYNFGAGAWAQEKSLIKITVAGATSAQQVDIEWGEIATYLSGSNGTMTIDVSYAIRGEYARGNTNGLITISSSGDIIDLPFVVLGLINPDNMIIPINAASEKTIGGYLPIIPPTKWIEPIFGLSDEVELYCTSEMPETSSLQLQYTLNNTIVTEELTPTLQTITIPTNAVGIQLVYSYIVGSLTLRSIHRFKREKTICGRNYAVVEWQSKSGQTKRQTWEVIRVTEKQNGATEFLTVDNSYSVSKGQEMELTLRLDGLSKYDYWYYSDILLSNDVRVAVNENDTDFGNETRVAVTNTSIEQPDNPDFYTLDITIKFRRYDEI